MIQKIYEIIVGAIALVALVAIVGISTFSVFALNPNNSPEKTLAKDITGQLPTVAGVSTTNQVTQFNNFVINNVRPSDEFYHTNLIANEDKPGYSYTVNLKSSAFVSEEKFIEVFNPSSTPETLTFETELIGGVQDSLKLNVTDDSDTLVLYSPERGVNIVRLTIPANTKRTLNIKYEFLQNINFSFEVKIKLS